MAGPDKRPKKPKDVMFSEVVADMMDQDFTLAIINYPDVKKFNGVKLAVYETEKWRKLNKTQIDPHFYDDNEAPIARFRPDGAGLEKAVKLFFPVMDPKEREIRMEMMRTFLDYAQKKHT